MVTRSLVVVNSALMSSGDGEGSGGAAALGSSGSSANTPQNNDDDEDEYRDVLQTARNVLGSSSTLHRAHTSYELLADSARNNDGNDDDDDDGDEESNEEQNESHNDRETTSSTDAQQHQPAYAYHEPLQPQSPMVTPPTRNYQRATVEASLAAATKPADRSALYDTYQQSAGVPHVYHDHSQVPDDSSFIRKKTGGVTQPFPEKLHEMLHAVAQTEASDIVSWLPHGRAFIVRKPKEFTEVLMPKYVHLVCCMYG
jgi:HSF-type DNA-binding